MIGLAGLTGSGKYIPKLFGIKLGINPGALAESQRQEGVRRLRGA